MPLARQKCRSREAGLWSLNQISTSWEPWSPGSTVDQLRCPDHATISPLPQHTKAQGRPPGLAHPHPTFRSSHSMICSQKWELKLSEAQGTVQGPPDGRGGGRWQPRWVSSPCTFHPSRPLFGAHCLICRKGQGCGEKMQ